MDPVSKIISDIFSRSVYQHQECSSHLRKIISLSNYVRFLHSSYKSAFDSFEKSRRTFEDNEASILNEKVKQIEEEREETKKLLFETTQRLRAVEKSQEEGEFCAERKAKDLEARLAAAKASAVSLSGKLMQESEANRQLSHGKQHLLAGMEEFRKQLAARAEELAACKKASEAEVLSLKEDNMQLFTTVQQLRIENKGLVAKKNVSEKESELREELRQSSERYEKLYLNREALDESLVKANAQINRLQEKLERSQDLSAENRKLKEAVKKEYGDKMQFAAMLKQTVLESKSYRVQITKLNRMVDELKLVQKRDRSVEVSCAKLAEPLRFDPREEEQGLRQLLRKVLEGRMDQEEKTRTLENLK